MATITLSDGRQLGYAEYGDMAGKPVFFFHGIPGSRLFRPPDEVTRKAGVRLICTERPGYGDSTFQAGRRMLYWPNDVAELANHLGIPRFAVMGHSGGGPYALACAYAIPDRVTEAVSLSGAGPGDAAGATEGMVLLHALAFSVGKHLPWWLLRAVAGRIYSSRLAALKAGIDREAERRVAADQRLYGQPEIRKLCDESEIEGLKQGMQGVAWDVRLLIRPWGFSLRKIGVPVQVWHGTADDQTSIPMARHMTKEIPGATCTICEGEAHLLLFPHWEEILAGLGSTV